MNRYRESVLRVRSILADEAVLGGTCYWLAGVYNVPWWSDQEQSGGPLNEQAAHLIDLIRFLMGEIIEVQGDYWHGNSKFYSRFDKIHR